MVAYADKSVIGGQTFGIHITHLWCIETILILYTNIAITVETGIALTLISSWVAVQSNNKNVCNKKVSIFISAHLLGGFTGGMNATIITHVAGWRYAAAPLQSVTFVALNTVTVLYTLLRIPLTNRICATKDWTTASSWHTMIGHIALKTG